LLWRKYRTTVIIELYRVCCPECGVKVEKVPQPLSKPPFSKDIEDAVGLACESAAVRQVARQFGLAASTVRAIDLRYLQRWSATRRKDRLEQMGVDEIYLAQLLPSGQCAQRPMFTELNISPVKRASVYRFNSTWLISSGITGQVNFV
jgi:hypothetical protein